MKLPVRCLYVLIVAFASCAVGMTADRKPVQVFILSGQSNMEGKAAVGTLEAVIRDEKMRAHFQHLKNCENWAVRDDVFVTYLDREETPVSPTHGPLTVGFGSPLAIGGRSAVPAMATTLLLARADPRKMFKRQGSIAGQADSLRLMVDDGRRSRVWFLQCRARHD